MPEILMTQARQDIDPTRGGHTTHNASTPNPAQLVARIAAWHRSRTGDPSADLLAQELSAAVAGSRVLDLRQVRPETLADVDEPLLRALGHAQIAELAMPAGATHRMVKTWADALVGLAFLDMRGSVPRHGGEAVDLAGVHLREVEVSSGTRVRFTNNVVAQVAVADGVEPAPWQLPATAQRVTVADEVLVRGGPDDDDRIVPHHERTDEERAAFPHEGTVSGALRKAARLVDHLPDVPLPLQHGPSATIRLNLPGQRQASVQVLPANWRLAPHAVSKKVAIATEARHVHPQTGQPLPVAGPSLQRFPHLATEGDALEWVHDKFSAKPNAHFAAMPYPTNDSLNLRSLVAFDQSWAGRIRQAFPDSPFVQALADRLAHGVDLDMATAALERYETKTEHKYLHPDGKKGAHLSAAALMDQVRDRYAGFVDDIDACLKAEQAQASPDVTETRSRSKPLASMSPEDRARLPALREFFNELKHGALARRLRIGGAEEAEMKTAMVMDLLGTDSIPPGTKLSSSATANIFGGAGLSLDEHVNLQIGARVIVSRIKEYEIGSDGEFNLKDFMSYQLQIGATGSFGTDTQAPHVRLQALLDLLIQTGEQFKADSPRKMFTAKADNRVGPPYWDSADPKRRWLVDKNAVVKNALYHAFFYPMYGRANPEKIDLSPGKATEGLGNNLAICNQAARFARDAQQAAEFRDAAVQAFPPLAAWHEKAEQTANPAALYAADGYFEKSYNSALGGIDSKGRRIVNAITRLQAGGTISATARLQEFSTDLKRFDPATGKDKGITRVDKEKAADLPLPTAGAAGSVAVFREFKSATRDKPPQDLMTARYQPIANLCAFQYDKIALLTQNWAPRAARDQTLHPVLALQARFDPLPALIAGAPAKPEGLPHKAHLYGDDIPPGFAELVHGIESGRIDPRQALAAVDAQIARLGASVKQAHLAIDEAFNEVSEAGRTARVQALNQSLLQGNARLDAFEGREKVCELSLAVNGAYGSANGYLSCLRTVCLREGADVLLGPVPGNTGTAGQTGDAREAAANAFLQQVDGGSRIYQQTADYLKLPIVAQTPVDRNFAAPEIFAAPSSKMRTIVTGSGQVNLQLNIPFGGRNDVPVIRSNALTPVRFNYTVNRTDGKASSNPIGQAIETEITFTFDQDSVSASALEDLLKASAEGTGARGRKLFESLHKDGQNFATFASAARGKGLTALFVESPGCLPELASIRMIRVTDDNQTLDTPNLLAAVPPGVGVLTAGAGMRLKTSLPEVEVMGAQVDYNLHQFRIHLHSLFFDGDISNPGKLLPDAERIERMGRPANQAWADKLFGGMAVPAVIEQFRLAALGPPGPDRPRNPFDDILNNPQMEATLAAAGAGKVYSAGAKPAELQAPPEPMFAALRRKAASWPEGMMETLKPDLQKMTPEQRKSFFTHEGSGIARAYADIMAEYHVFNEFRKTFRGYQYTVNMPAMQRQYGPGPASRNPFALAYQGTDRSKNERKEDIAHRKALDAELRQVQDHGWLRRKLTSVGKAVGIFRGPTVTGERAAASRAAARQVAASRRGLLEPAGGSLPDKPGLLGLLRHFPTPATAQAAAGMSRLALGTLIDELPRVPGRRLVTASEREEAARFNAVSSRREHQLNAEDFGPGEGQPFMSLANRGGADSLFEALGPLRKPMSPEAVQAMREQLARHLADEPRGGAPAAAQRRSFAEQLCGGINAASGKDRKLPSEWELGDLDEVPRDVYAHYLRTAGMPGGADTLVHFCRQQDAANASGKPTQAPTTVAVVHMGQREIRVYGAEGLRSIQPLSGQPRDEAIALCEASRRTHTVTLLQDGLNFQRVVKNRHASVSARLAPVAVGESVALDPGDGPASAGPVAALTAAGAASVPTASAMKSRQTAATGFSLQDFALESTGPGNKLLVSGKAGSPLRLQENFGPAADSLAAALGGSAQPSTQEVLAFRDGLSRHTGHRDDAASRLRYGRLVAAALGETGQAVDPSRLQQMPLSKYKEVLRSPGMPMGPDALLHYCRQQDARRVATMSSVSTQQGNLPVAGRAGTQVAVMSPDTGHLCVYDAHGLVLSEDVSNLPREAALARCGEVAATTAVALVHRQGRYLRLTVQGAKAAPEVASARAAIPPVHVPLPLPASAFQADRAPQPTRPQPAANGKLATYDNYRYRDMPNGVCHGASIAWLNTIAAEGLQSALQLHPHKQTEVLRLQRLAEAGSLTALNMVDPIGLNASTYATLGLNRFFLQRHAGPITSAVTAQQSDAAFAKWLAEQLPQAGDFAFMNMAHANGRGAHAAALYRGDHGRLYYFDPSHGTHEYEPHRLDELKQLMNRHVGYRDCVLVPGHMARVH